MVLEQLDVCIRKEKWNPYSTPSVRVYKRLNMKTSWAWCLALVSPGTGRLRQEDCHEFKVLPALKPDLGARGRRSARLVLTIFSPSFGRLRQEFESKAWIKV